MNNHRSQPAVVWFRSGDLRLSDNLALEFALKQEPGRPVLPLFVWSPHEPGIQQPGAASRWWLHHSLAALQTKLRARGSKLTIRRARSETLEAVCDFIDEVKAERICWNQSDPGGKTDAFEDDISDVVSWRCKIAGATRQRYLFGRIETTQSSGRPYQVFTPFYKNCLRLMGQPGWWGALNPRPLPERIPVPQSWPASETLESLGLLPRGSWTENLSRHWNPGEAGAQARLSEFLAAGSHGDYALNRDYPALRGTSKLSPHLHFGELSPRVIWHAVEQLKLGAAAEQQQSADAFLRQLIWREFADHLLYHFPHTVDQPLREDFKAFPWAQPVGAGDSPELLCWKRGQTGYPIVDAAMRELWLTGWMHNRCRMIVASFLCKHLLIPWQEGAAWFWDTLVDADLGNNTLGWQWVAGCGADAAPYFRIFNPVLQGEKFDPQGAYVRRWCPELSALPDKLIHAPWTASPLELASAGITLVDSLRDADKLPAHKVGPLPQPGAYPRPMVDHAFARDRALAAYASIRRA